jgi:membrane protease YdiL (CAAX protease family)
LKEKLAISRDYIEEAKVFQSIDILLALIVFVVLFVSYFFLGRFFYNLGDDLTNVLLNGFQFGHIILILALIVIICLLRKQTLSSIGITNKNIKRSSLIGLIISVVIFLFFGIMSNWQSNYNLPKSLLTLLYFFFIIALPEELIFRGFIGKRLYGVIKNKLVAIIITGILFTLIHLPFQIAYNGLTISEYFSSSAVNLIFVFLLHFVFHYMYAKYNNIAMPTIVHTIWDFAQKIFL